MKKIVAISVLFTASLFATDYTILVAEKRSKAYNSAKKLAAKSQQTYYKNKVFKAFKQAHKILSQGKNDTVNIKIAAGKYFGKAKSGYFGFKEVKNAKGSLRILGGYGADFKKRAPFFRYTKFVVPTDRSNNVIKFEGKKHKLKELVISGIVFDVANGNKYDKDINALKKGSSCTFPILNVGYLETNRLEISDNTFMNSAHMAAAPLIRPASPKALVVVKNNFFVNNVYTWKADAAGFRNKLGHYMFINNSFLFNWPYNPDPTSGTVASLEVASKSRLKKVSILNNIFAYNVGGAIMPMYDEDYMPEMAIKGNVFYANGTLFSAKKKGEYALVGKFNKSATYLGYKPEEIEDEFDWDVAGNGVVNPQVSLKMAKLQSASSYVVTAKKTDMNALRGMLGLNKQGGSVKISNYAPKMQLDIKNYFSKNKKLSKIGVRKKLVKQY